MPVYDEDSDSGDISLSLPLSRSSPQLSTILSGNGNSSSSHASASAGASASRGGPSGGVASPTPQRLLGKNLWTKPGTLSPVPAPSVSSVPAASTYRDTRRSPPNAPLGDDVDDGDRDDDLTPVATPSTLWGSDVSRPREQPRPSSAQSPPRTAQGPHAFRRRTSSSGSMTRSRSMNVRLPSINSNVNAGDAEPAGPSSAVNRTPSTRLGWNRRPGDPRPPPLVPDTVCQGMKRWIKEIVICNFDLERGPVVERRVIGRRWGPGEKENVAFSSFPDTSLFAEGSIMFSFKIRHIPPDPSTLSQPEPPSPMPDRTLHPTGLGPRNSDDSRSSTPLSGFKDGDKADEYRKWDERGREWLYGFVWFEQRRDGGIARGYMQKSLVILTHLPFPSLFFAVLQRVAPIFFEHGYSALEAACHSIASWPDPMPDSVLDAPLLSELLHVKLPDANETPQVGFSRPSPERPILASLPPTSPLRTFATFLPSLWSLWECLILAEPVLVIAPDPKTCSEIVWWLRDLLRPIPPAGDFRPYLHIHDHDFSLLVNSNKPQAGVVVGVTNPFFRNAASHWPNVISISSGRPRRGSATSSSQPDQPEGFVSRRHRSVQKDRPLLKRLEQLVAEGKYDDPAGNEALRTHFQQLTEKMLVPLNRYFQTLVPTLSPVPSPLSSPLPGGTTPSGSGSLKPFSLPAFLTHLKTRGPNPLSFRTRGLSTKSRVESDFYTSFCMSPTFAGWLAARVTSLGIAVAAQSSATLAVPIPNATPRAPRGAPVNIVGLGIDGNMADLALSDGRSSPATIPRDSSDDAETRSSGSSAVGSLPNGMRLSEESSISAEYLNARRGSDGMMKVRRGY